jgi:hypothetical protein
MKIKTQISPYKGRDLRVTTFFKISVSPLTTFWDISASLQKLSHH